MSNSLWMGKNKLSKKRKADELTCMDDDDDGDAIVPFALPKLFNTNSTVYTHMNHIYFNDDITAESMFSLNKELRQLESRLLALSVLYGMPVQPIILHITTHGGCIHSAFTTVDCISSLKTPVYTVAEGFVASAGTLLTLAGEKRYITENAYMLIHELRSGVWGKMSSIEEEYSNLKKVMEHITNYYVKRTNLSKKSLEKILTKDIIWNAQECIEKSIVEDFYKQSI